MNENTTSKQILQARAQERKRGGRPRIDYIEKIMGRKGKSPQGMKRISEERQKFRR